MAGHAGQSLPRSWDTTATDAEPRGGVRTGPFDPSIGFGATFLCCRSKGAACGSRHEAVTYPQQSCLVVPGPSTQVRCVGTTGLRQGIAVPARRRFSRAERFCPWPPWSPRSREVPPSRRGEGRPTGRPRPSARDLRRADRRERPRSALWKGCRRGRPVHRLAVRNDAAALLRGSSDPRRLPRTPLLTGGREESIAFWRMVHPSAHSSCTSALRLQGRAVIPDFEAWDDIAGTEDLLAFRRAGIRSAQTTPLLSRDGRLLGMISTH